MQEPLHLHAVFSFAIQCLVMPLLFKSNRIIFYPVTKQYSGYIRNFTLHHRIIASDTMVDAFLECCKKGKVKSNKRSAIQV